MRTFVLLLGCIALVGCNDKKGTPGTTTPSQNTSTKTQGGGAYTGTFEVGPVPKEVPK